MMEPDPAIPAGTAGVSAPHPLPGRFDVHSHLLPGVDDGCETLAESLECARRLVGAGYSHSFCTPHIWPNLPENSVGTIPRRVATLQSALDKAGIPLKLYPGGEISLRTTTPLTPVNELVSYAMQRRFVLIDLWDVPLPAFFEPAVAWLQSQGVKVILAHPERMHAVQADPVLADRFAELGLLLQGNLQCFGDPPGAPTRRVAERYLAEGRYFLLGSDLHRLETLAVRLEGLRRATELAGADLVYELTAINPRTLLQD